MRHEPLMRRLAGRLRRTPLSVVAFQLLTTIAITGDSLPYALPLVMKNGPMGWISHHWMPNLLIAVIMLGVQQLAIDGSEDRARLPARFLAALAAGAALAVAANCAFFALEFDVRPQFGNWQFLFGNLLYWIYLMTFGAMFGWLSLLFSRRARMRSRLALMQVHRSLLSRRLAQSRLAAARADLDPQTVACILRHVQSRYRSNPAAGNALLDQLIVYLRGIMNRERKIGLTLASERELTAAYVVLRSAETGAKIDLTISGSARDDAQSGPGEAPPLYLAVRTILDGLAPKADDAVALSIALHDARITVRLDAGRPLPAAVPAELRRSLAAVQGATQISLELISPESRRHAGQTVAA